MLVVDEFSYLLKLYRWNITRLIYEVTSTNLAHLIKIPAARNIKESSRLTPSPPMYQKNIDYVSVKNGIKFGVRPKTIDKEIVDEVFLNRFYTPRGFEINEEDIVVDIGAHIGVFSIFASELAKKGKVYSVEPMPGNIEMLKNNMSINKIENIVPINMAVSNKRGKRKIILGKSTGMHSFYLGKSSKTLEVQTICLQDIVEEYKIPRIDFLKVDCEGAEYEILFDCPKHILNIVERMCLEWHNIDSDRNILTLKRFLEEKGFDTGFRMGPGNFLVTGYLYASRRNSAISKN
jgi:FkbM family methyltransferase